MAKKRIDQLLVEQNKADTLERAKALLMAGRVQVNRQPITKPGALINPNAQITVKETMPYVSRGGYKLEAALRNFNVDPTGAICADVGASTGGFTDVLLQRGAKKVYAIDVGYGILAWKLRQDPRVIVMERTNARKLEKLPEPVSLVVVDASFISLKLILPAALKWIESEADFVVLVKPQFEAAKEQVEKGGVIRSKAIHIEVLTGLIDWCAAAGLNVLDIIASPIQGPAGNREFLMHLNVEQLATPPTAAALIEQCFQTLS